MSFLEESEILPYKNYTWIVHHPDLLGGQPAIKGTRLSVSMILEALAEGMTPEEIRDDYPGFLIEAIPDVLRFAAEHTSKPIEDPDVAA